MRCIYCNAPLSGVDYCAGCGADITIQRRIQRISNLLYNEGLEKARVRDMEGAIACLKRSLKFSKENTDARNLLGLCYYETGEAVSALCEWVVSKNLQQQDNLADFYINEVQGNKNRLDTLNQTIRKYNQSIQYCREDNEDMAIIQLKKVISRNPQLVRAYQLLALLYMKRQEYERARKLLKKAARVDRTNTRTMRYLQEIEEVTGKGTGLEARWHRKPEQETEEKVSGTLRYMSGTEMIIQPTTFRDSSTIATFINILLGILLGGAIVWFLVVPASRQSINDAANRTVTEANTKLAAATAEAEDLQEQIDGYESEVESANQERDDAKAVVESYDALLAAANLYISGDQDTAATQVAALDADDFEGNAKTLYDTLSGSVQGSLFNQYYAAGTTAYVQGDYASAAAQLKNAVEADPERTQSNHYNAMLYLGMAYYYQGNTANADDIFNQIVEYYPEQASQVQGYISSSGTTSSGTGGADTTTLDLSGLGGASTAQTDASGTSQTDASASQTDASASQTDAAGTSGTGSSASEDIITIYGDDTGADVAWTDPSTGLNYDAYGNLIG